jgi:hypothetical protein
MKKIPAILIIIAITTDCFSQNSFQKLIGGPQHERAQTVFSTSDNGIMVNAATGSYGAGDIDMMLLKLDSTGNILWSNTYGTTVYDNAEFAIETSDHNLICTGRSIINSGSPASAIIFKTDSSGNLSWSKSYGGTSDDGFVHIIETSDNGFAAVGNTKSLSSGESDILFVRTDINGDTIFTHSYGTVENETGSYVVQLPDNGFLITGRQTTVNGTKADGILLRTDSAGNQLWCKLYGDTLFEEFTAVQQTTDGGFIIAGSTTGNGSGGFDILLMKTDTGGAVQWSHAYGGIYSDAAYDLHVTNDNGFIMSGFTESLGYGNPVGPGVDHSNIYLMKTDSSGDVQWMQTYGDGLQDEAFRSAIASDGGFLVGGFTKNYLISDSSQMIIIKTDSMGNSGCHEDAVTPADSVFGIIARDTIFTELSGLQTGTFNLVQAAVGTNNDDACLFSKINPAHEISTLEVFPNPFSNQLTLNNPLENAELIIYDSSGMRCYSSKLSFGITDINVASLPGGIYHLIIRNNSQQLSKTIVHAN